MAPSGKNNPDTENSMCKGPEIEEGSMKKKIILNFNNYISGQLKTFIEFLLKVRHSFVSVIYFS